MKNNVNFDALIANMDQNIGMSQTPQIEGGFGKFVVRVVIYLL
ncbi:hypothetical protein [Colwellia sp. 6M3]|nr:hypothetical protein [Colwellia sp. 6M3]